MTNGGTDRQGGGVLVRIVLLLLSLAALADRAENFPAPIRCAVLWLLRRAEIVARLFVIGPAADCGFRANVAAPVLARGCASRQDAAALADAFEILAQVLDALLPYADAMPEPAGQAPGLYPAGLGAIIQRLQQPAAPAAPFPDTS